MSAPEHWRLREVVTEADHWLHDPPRRIRCGGCRLTVEGLSVRSMNPFLWDRTCAKCCRRYNRWLTGRDGPRAA